MRFQLIRGACVAGVCATSAIDENAARLYWRDCASPTTCTMLTKAGSGRTPFVGAFRFSPRHRPRPQLRASVAEQPSNHSPFYAPRIEPTLGVGVAALVVAARTWLPA